jgi:hypothetical protein
LTDPSFNQFGVGDREIEHRARRDVFAASISPAISRGQSGCVISVTAMRGVLQHNDTHKSAAEWSAPQTLERTMKTLEKTFEETLNDEALESVAGGVWDDGGCIPDFLNKILKQILHPSKPGGPINVR